MTPLFSKTLARQAAQVLEVTQGDLLELGAGTGQMTADLLLALAQLNQLPRQYSILEVSAYLREKQRKTLKKNLSAELFSRVVWLETLPETFTGLILGNEVLDAMPVSLVVKNDDVLHERGIAFEDGFVWQDKPLQDENIYRFVQALNLPNDYLTEVCPAATGFINSLADILEYGVIIMLDYGFSAQEYYHSQRDRGTLMCHFQHYAHSNPLLNIGLQDITAHVNFTSIAAAGIDSGLTLDGYCNQAHFLINCGMLDLLAETSAEDIAGYAPLAAAVQKLLSPAEMGELFKVIALSKNIDTSLIGFSNGDKAHTL
jgi:SAM-dependent MidA family methyltransferase